MLRGTVLAVLSCALAVNLHAQTYYLMSNMANGDWGPPLPMNPCASCPVYSVGSNNYWIDDRSELGLSSMSFSAMSADGIDPGDTNNLATNSNGQGIISPMDLPYTTNGSLWIEAYSNDTQNIYLQLHNTTNAYLYQIFSTTNLLLPSASWTPGQAQVGKSDTNLTPFDAIPMTNGQAFFRGQQGNTVIFVDYATVAYESNSDVGTPAQPGYIEFSAQPGVDNSLAVHYTLGGSARNGVDYTNLSGVATIPGNGNNTVQVYVQPISPSTLTNSIETVDFTVQPSTDYLVASSQSSGTVLIKSSSTTVGVDAGTNAVRPIAPGFPARDGNFTLYRNDDFGLNPPLTVQYQVSGTASNGLDYQLLSGSIAFAQDSTSTNLDVTPLAESPLQGTKTLTLTVLGTTDYAAASNSFTRTIDIDDQTNAVSICDTNHAINSNGPPGAPAQEGSFSLYRDEPDGFLPETTVNYVMSGEASNSVDYALLNGTVTFAEGQRYLTVPIDPISSWTNTAKTVVMTLVPGNYFIDSNSVYLPGGAAITNYIQNSSSEISVIWTKDAVEPQGTNLAQTGVFTVSRHDGRDRYDQLSVNYTLSGSAINGVDYTNLSGVVTFAPGARQTNIYVGPILDTNYPGDKMAKLSLTPATYYYIDTGFPSVGTNYSSAIVVILDNNIVFQATTNFNGLIIGLVYNPYVTNLIVSEETGRPDFKAIGTNITQIGGNIVTNVVITNWSNIGTLGDEVYMALATNSSSGFTNGDMFFGANTGVGWLSSNAAVSNLSWSALTNAAITNSSLLRGGICFDSTGAFSNNLIAVGVSGEVWEVDSQAHPTFLAQITNTALVEGVCVVPANFGPWSKQIITGDEVLNLLYLIDTNKIVTQVDPEILFPGGVNSESISIIPSNQSLYLAGSRGEIIKLPASYFKNYSGDLMIHDGAERGSINKLLIVHWDAASSNFVSWRVRCTLSCPEGAAFAPIELPVN